MPIVLVHGIPTCPALWRHVIALIAGARCLAWEMVGYGKRFTPEDHPDVIAEEIRALLV